MKKFLKIFTFMIFALLSLYGETRELTLRSSLGDVSIQEQNHTLIIHLKLSVNSDNPQTIALYVAAIHDFIDSVTDQIVQHFEQLDDNLPVASFGQIESNFVLQLQEQMEQHVNSYVQRNQARTQGTFLCLLHSAIFFTFLAIHESQ